VNTTWTRARTTPLSLVLAIVVGSALLVPIIGSPTPTTGSRSPLRRGTLLLIGAAALLALLRRRASAPDRAAAIHRATVVGIGPGAAVGVEIGVNNLVAPPLPQRDVIDDVFWGVIAAGILAYASAAAYRFDRVTSGIEAGAWSGFVSGALACGAGLSLIVFAMGLILHDPLNVTEWAARGTASGAPTMAAYFAWETFAGAILHLTVLGVIMGGLLASWAARSERRCASRAGAFGLPDSRWTSSRSRIAHALYFAYGSNLSSERLRHPDRAPSARVVGTASLSVTSSPGTSAAPTDRASARFAPPAGGRRRVGVVWEISETT
jgi:hypothetical protein